MAKRKDKKLPAARAIAFRLSYGVVDSVDAMAKGLGLSRNKMVELLLRQGVNNTAATGFVPVMAAPETADGQLSFLE